MTQKMEKLDPRQRGAAGENLLVQLREMVVGQDDAIETVVNIYQSFLADMNPQGRPIGNFLFLGPTGSGKTRMVEATAEAILGDPKALIKIDCGEFQHGHEIAKLIGSPPGYLGHRETHPLLSQEVLNQYYTDKIKLSLVLFDEIEKAHDALWNLLLGILDKATLTLGDNRRVDFSRTLVFMTSNLGSADMDRLLRPNIGFAPRHIDNTGGRLAHKIDHAGTTAARRRFTPEFMNRIDRVVAFHALGEKELREILDIELDIVRQRISNAKTGPRFVFDVAPTAQEFLLREGTDVRYGARHLKRAIERHLAQPLANLIASRTVRNGDFVVVDHNDNEGLVFLREASGLATGTTVSTDQLVEDPATSLPPNQSFTASASVGAGIHKVPPNK
jgi:ATP-dependent Clp protease ATP-binding subunit ClpB